MGFGELLFFGLLVALANVAWALLLARPAIFRPSRHFLSCLVALGAGFMLAAIFIEIVPEVVVLWGKSGEPGHGVLGAMTLLLAGYLLIHFFEHTIAPPVHCGEETHPEAVVRTSAAYTAIGGLSIHTFFDGASVASAFVVGRKVGLVVFVAVLLHKVPEGFGAASIFLGWGRGRARALPAALILAGAPLFGVLTVAVPHARGEQAVAYAL